MIFSVVGFPPSRNIFVVLASRKEKNEIATIPGIINTCHVEKLVLLNCLQAGINTLGVGKA